MSEFRDYSFLTIFSHIAVFILLFSILYFIFKAYQYLRKIARKIDKANKNENDQDNKS